jgi:hypothetical protein
VSSYQYYEFQAIDRLLTVDEQQAVARLSSRVEPHPRQAVFVYHWGSFPAKPGEILLRYFDVLFYTSSWGSRQIMFRFPRAAVDVESARAYCEPLIVEETISFSSEAGYTLLNVEFHEEGGGEWSGDTGSLAAMLSLRDDLVRGDYRAPNPGLAQGAGGGGPARLGPRAAGAARAEGAVAGAADLGRFSGDRRDADPGRCRDERRATGTV